MVLRLRQHRDSVEAELADSAVPGEARLTPVQQLRLRQMQTEMIRRMVALRSGSAAVVDGDKPTRWTVER
jgi:hypothetical protein